MHFFKKLLNSNRKKAFDAYKKGISFYNKMDYARAIDCFERMQSEKPLKKHLEYKLATFYCGLSHRNLGIVAFTRNDNVLALDHFKKALQCNPRHIDLNYFIGICLNNLGEFQAAMDAFKIIQETEPWNIPNKLKMAIILHNLKMWSHAEKIHRDLLEKHPGFADVHYHLGIVLMNQGKSEEAAQSFEKALEINPGYINARIKLGIAQICMGQLSQAEEQFNTILQKKPDYADVNYLISIIKLEKNDPDAAIQYLRRAVTISPRFKNAQVKLIITLCRQNRTTEAQEQLEQALKHYPEDPRLKAVQKFIHVLPADFTGNHTVAAEFKAVFNNENAIAALRNEFHKGLDIMPNFSEIIAIFCNSKFSGEDVGISDFLIPLIKEQIEKNPTYPDLYNSLGTQYNLINNTIEAEAAFARAVALNPNYMTARINLLKAQYQNGRYMEACENGRIILSRNLPFPDVYHTMAQVLFKLEKYDSALINARKALQMQPSFKRIHLLMAQIYEAQGDNDLAVAEIRKCLSPNGVSGIMTEARQMLKRLQNIS